MPLALQLSWDEGRGHRVYYQSGPLLRLRPMRPGKKHGWIKSGITWTNVPAASQSHVYEPAQLEVVKALHAALERHGGYWYAGREPTVGDFGPDVVPAAPRGAGGRAPAAAASTSPRSTWSRSRSSSPPTSAPTDDGPAGRRRPRPRRPAVARRRGRAVGRPGPHRPARPRRRRADPGPAGAPAAPRPRARAGRARRCGCRPRPPTGCPTSWPGCAGCCRWARATARSTVPEAGRAAAAAHRALEHRRRGDARLGVALRRRTSSAGTARDPLRDRRAERDLLDRLPQPPTPERREVSGRRRPRTSRCSSCRCGAPATTSTSSRSTRPSSARPRRAR